MPYLKPAILRNMLESKRDTKEEQVKKIREAFDLFDEDGTRTISVKDLQISMRPLGFKPDPEEINKLKFELDKEGTGKIHFNDFFTLMTKKMAERNAEEEIQKAFNFFDDDNTGKISLKNLKRVASQLGENVSEEELQEMIDHADLDGDGEVDPQEFLSVIKKARKF
ncbi:caltractin-like [Gracilinanus agilis]|uniref:caltractin-like n=1 Tax=Gracilinanus agilis TaxID=191870 RepID=UPI001CFCDF24|nr:caltractin-like [Gracilinanus agilis]